MSEVKKQPINETFGPEIKMSHEENVKDPHAHKILNILGKDCAPDGHECIGYVTTFVYASNVMGQVVFKHVMRVNDMNEHIAGLAIADQAKAVATKVGAIREHKWLGAKKGY